MKLINCDLLEVVPDRLYGGATGSKIAVRFDGCVCGCLKVANV